MATKRTGFLDSDEGEAVRRSLLNIVADESYNTSSTFSANSSTYPDNQIPFVDKHMQYLYMHPEVETTMYINNIKLKTRIRR